MRSAIATLIAAAGVATSALAQTPPPAAPMAPPAAPPAPPAATAPATAPTTPPANPGADAQPPAATAPAAEAPASEKTYVIPTEGEVGQIINVINTICIPVVHDGADMAKLAKAAGYKENKRDGTYVGTLVQKPYLITLYAPGSNKNVCRMQVNYTTGQEKPIIVGLNIWSLLHKPELEQQRNDYVPATDFKRITNSWEYLTDHQSIGLVFLQLKKPDGSEISPKFGTAEVLYSERSF